MARKSPKIELSPDFLDFIRLSNENSLEYLLIGGYAVGLHGSVRATKDIDFWFNPEAENSARLERVLALFGTQQFVQSELQELGMVFQLGFAPNRIDLLNDPLPGQDFAAVYARRKQVEVAPGLEVKLIDKQDLIALKRYAARAQDLADIEKLGG